MTGERHSPRWEFYPCRVDGRPASISVDLGFEDGPLPDGKDTLFWVRSDMVDPGDNGLGTPAEVASFAPIESAVSQMTEQYGHVRVGRVRNHDAWLLLFYGTTHQLAHLQEAVRTELQAFEGRDSETGARTDAEWSYYREFLAPGPQARQWIADYRSRSKP